MGLTHAALTTISTLIWLAMAIAPAPLQAADNDAAPAPSAEAPTPPAVGTPPPLPEGFRTYTLARSFAIQIPEDWVSVGTVEARSAVITNYDPDRGGGPQAGDIKTEVQFSDESPNTAISRAVDELVASGYTVTHYSFIEVNGILALRLRVADVPGDYPYQFITYIGYASYGTAMLISHSVSEMEPETWDLLGQIHGSFVPVYR
ncbi:MAG: hypothetical protein O3C67_02230 [Cyanobacteria bacterium]|nr:hypothetical protein [Cyanobacteriota bacterium]